MKKYIAKFLASLVIAGVFFSSVAFAANPLIPLRPSGSGLIYTTPADELGTLAVPWLKGYFVDLDVSGLFTFGGTMMSNLDMDGYDIIMDTDGDSVLTNDRDVGINDDEIGVTLAGVLDFLFDENLFVALAGSGISTALLNTLSAGDTITLAAIGGVNDENLIIDLDTTANEINFGTGTGVLDFDYDSIDLNTTGEVNAEHLVSTDDANISGKTTSKELDVIYTDTSYTTEVPFSKLSRTGDLTGGVDEIIMDFRVDPQFTLTGPASGTTSYIAQYMALGGVNITPGVGDTATTTLFVAASRDTSTLYNHAIYSSGKVIIDQSDNNQTQALKVYYDSTKFASHEGIVEIERAGNLTGVAGEYILDFEVTPNMTLTEPATGIATYMGVRSDLDNLSVTGAGGDSQTFAGYFRASTDADSTNVAMYAVGESTMALTDANSTRILGMLNTVTGEDIYSSNSYAGYTDSVGRFDSVRSGNFTGVAGETAIDMRIAPTSTITEPATGSFYYAGNSIDMSGLSVTAGAGDSAVIAQSLTAGTDTDTTNLALWTQGAVMMTQSDANAENTLSIENSATGENVNINNDYAGYTHDDAVLNVRDTGNFTATASEYYANLHLASEFTITEPAGAGTFQYFGADISLHNLGAVAGTGDVEATALRVTASTDVDFSRTLAFEAVGDTLLNGAMTLSGVQTFTPSADEAKAAGDSLTVSKAIMRVAGSGGAVTLTSTPHIVDATDGTCVIIQGTHDTNTLTFQDESNLANSGMQLDGGLDFTLGKGDILQVCYDSGDDDWNEISRSNN